MQFAVLLLFQEEISEKVKIMNTLAHYVVLCCLKTAFTTDRNLWLKTKKHPFRESSRYACTHTCIYSYIMHAINLNHMKQRKMHGKIKVR